IIIGSFTERPISHYYIDEVVVRPVASASECDCYTEITFDMTGYDEMNAGDVIRMAFIDFEPGTATFMSSAKIELDNLFYLLEEHPSMKIIVQVHTEAGNDQESDMKLSEERAKAVTTYLTGRGTAEDMLSAKGYGSSRPLSDNDTEEGRNRNRRIEIKILEK
ncbi:MAG: OmpA family protein, partial [Bacteroidetes bacterium]|nr:OmpA family protein [Bacteroidota bacterium]